MHPEPNLEAIEATLTALFETIASQLEDEVTSEANYPDLVPRITRKLSPAAVRETSSIDFELPDPGATAGGPMSETFFLLAIFFGTCILLYLFPTGP